MDVKRTKPLTWWGAWWCLFVGIALAMRDKYHRRKR